MDRRGKNCQKSYEQNLTKKLNRDVTLNQYFLTTASVYFTSCLKSYFLGHHAQLLRCQSLQGRTTMLYVLAKILAFTLYGKALCGTEP